MGDLAYLQKDLSPSAKFLLGWEMNNMREWKCTTLNTSGCATAFSFQRDKK